MTCFLLEQFHTGHMGIRLQDEWSPCPDCQPEAAKAAKAKVEAAAAAAAMPEPPPGADAAKQPAEEVEGAAGVRRSKGSLELLAGSGYDLDDLDWDALEELAAEQLKVASHPYSCRAANPRRRLSCTVHSRSCQGPFAPRCIGGSLLLGVVSHSAAHGLHRRHKAAPCLVPHNRLIADRLIGLLLIGTGHLDSLLPVPSCAGVCTRCEGGGQQPGRRPACSPRNAC